MLARDRLPLGVREPARHRDRRKRTQQFWAQRKGTGLRWGWLGRDGASEHPTVSSSEGTPFLLQKMTVQLNRDRRSRLTAGQSRVAAAEVRGRERCHLGA